MPVTPGATPTEVNLNGTVPAAPIGETNVTWQAGAAYPDPNNPQKFVRDTSAYMPNMVGDSGSGGTAGAVPSPGSGDAAAGKFLKADGTWEVPPGNIGTVGIVIDGAGSVLSTGSKGYIQVEYAGTIVGWTLLADQAGSAQITVKKSTYSGFPTTASIVASAPPNLSSAQKNTSTALTGWTAAIAAGDVLEFNLDSATTVTRLVLELKIQKS